MKINFIYIRVLISGLVATNCVIQLPFPTMEKAFF
jgi:hypothetical protein